MVSALFVRDDSIYKQLNIDSWDINRDARNFTGTNVVIAHPPCRAWGQLSHLAKPRHDEKELAIFAVNLIQKNGGILEHPRASKLWKHCNLPTGNLIDQYGGWTLSINQSWFGHKCRKSTLLYIVGVKPAEIIPYPISLDRVTHSIGTSNRSYPGMKEVSKKYREYTPPNLAKWLIEVAKQIYINKHNI